MARPRTRAPKPTGPNSRVLVASGAALPSPTRNSGITSSEQWQAEVWRYYDLVPELRFVANWVGNVMSRAVLRAVTNTTGIDTLLPDTDPAAASLASYFEGEEGQAEMLRLTGIHLTVAGECYHVYRASDETWHVLATGKVTQTGKGEAARIAVDYGNGTFVPIDKGLDMVIRVWQPHPTEPLRADSPARANISTLEEIVRATGATRAILMSRLAGAGLLLLPNDMEFDAPEDRDPAAPGEFMRALTNAITAAIADPNAPSAVVPILVQGPSEAITAARHMTFGQDLSEQIRLMRDNAVKRLGLGMDIPPEVLTGIADTNRWNAWLIDEASVKAHTEPRLALVANAVTTAYLWPSLDDNRAARVGADTTAIRLRPNRSREAVELWDRGELSASALRRETGFDDGDNPPDDERKQWLLRRVATASAVDPLMVADALRILGVDVTPPEPTPTRGVREVVPTLKEHPSRDLPADAMLAAANVLVLRALERAGNRLKSKHRYTGRLTAAALYRELDGNPDVLLDGAWDLLPDVVPGADETLAFALDQYVRGLLHTKAEHSVDSLRRHLTAVEALVVH